MASKNIPGIVVIGKYGLFPNPDLDLTVVIGKPIQFPEIAEPTKEHVDHWHKLYMNQLVKLFNDNKEQYAEDPLAELELV